MVDEMDPNFLLKDFLKRRHVSDFNEVIFGKASRADGK